MRTLVKKLTYNEQEARIQELEAELRNSKVKFDHFLKYAPLPYQSLDENGDFLEVNQFLLDTLGYTEDELIGKNFGDLLHPDWVDHFKSNFPRFKAVGEVLGVEFEMVKKDGTTILVSFNGRIQRDNEDSFERTHCIFQDVTSRAKAEQVTSENSQRFFTLFNENPTPTWEEDFSEVFNHLKKIQQTGVTDFRKYFNEHPDELKLCSSKTKVLDVNKAAIELHGAKDKKELLGNLDKIFTEKSLFAFKEELIAIANGEKEFEIEGEVRTLTGQVKHVLVTLVVQKQTNDISIALITTTDITQQKTYQTKLENLHTAIDNSLNGFGIVDKNRNFVYVNKAYVKMWGYDNKEEVLNCNPSLHCKDPDIPRQIISKLRSDGKCIIEFIARRKDGSFFDVLMYARLAYDENGLEIYPSTSIDITEKKNAEKALKEKEKQLARYQNHLEQIIEERNVELKEAQKKLLQKEKLAAIGQLAGSVAHDIRNPLGAISNSIYFLNQTQEDSKKELQKKHFQIMEREIFKANEIITDLMNFSKEATPVLTRSDINILLRNILDELDFPSNINKKLDLTPHIPSFFFDTNQIQRACLNLIINAIQAMPEGGTLLVSSSFENNIVTINFHDTGVGISNENIENIFDPLYTTKPKGVGLGLTIVHTFIEKHDGLIEVESEVGQGSNFIISLPIEPLKEKKQ